MTSRCSHGQVVLFLESFSGHLILNMLIEVTTVPGRYLSRDSSARVAIVSRVSLPSFSASVLVRKVAKRIAGDIRVCEARVLYP